VSFLFLFCFVEDEEGADGEGIDSPDAAIIYDEIMKLLEKDEYAPYASDVVVMRIGPSDQSRSSS
jgi:hypothetical protein